MTNRIIQRTLERSECNKCLNVGFGTRVRGGFLCEECVRLFVIRKQLWVYPEEYREQFIVEEGLKKR